MWLQRRFDHLVPFFDAGHEMGFQAFEFSHILYPRFFDGVEPGNYRIAAVHDPCPRPTAGPGQLSALDEAERRRAVEVAKASIDTAVRFGAGAVVLHTGRVDGVIQHEQALRALHLRGECGTPAYAAARERLVSARAERAPAHLSAVRRSLQELAEHAEKHAIRVGLENRVAYFEMPSFEETQELLDGLPADVVGFWYDTGHARVLDNLGFIPYLTWAETFQSRMIGVHFHDVGGLRDHLLPGMAEIDFGAVASLVPENAVRTCEFDWHFAPVGVEAGVEHLRQAGCF
jgi:sugar phosphate isomerase/epimerase